MSPRKALPFDNVIAHFILWIRNKYNSIRVLMFDGNERLLIRTPNITPMIIRYLVISQLFPTSAASLAMIVWLDTVHWLERAINEYICVWYRA